MNCWLDGTELTMDDFVTLAVELGKLTREEVGPFMGDGHAFPSSKIMAWTAERRFEMFSNGELLLRTRIRSEEERANIPANPDNELFHWLTKGAFKDEFERRGTTGPDGRRTLRPAQSGKHGVSGCQSGQPLLPRAPAQGSQRGPQAGVDSPAEQAQRD